MALNSLCMPGLFYYFICLMRAWGLDFGAPPALVYIPRGGRRAEPPSRLRDSP